MYLFIAQLVLKRGPCVHGNRPELYLHIDVPDPENHVVAPVAVGLRVPDVVLFFDHLDARHRDEIIADRKDIVEKRADDPDTDSVMNPPECGFLCLRKSLPAAFFPHAFIGFDPVQAVFHRILAPRRFLFPSKRSHPLHHLAEGGFHTWQRVPVDAGGVRFRQRISFFVRSGGNALVGTFRFAFCRAGEAFLRRSLFFFLFLHIPVLIPLAFIHTGSYCIRIMNRLLMRNSFSITGRCEEMKTGQSKRTPVLSDSDCVHLKQMVK